MPALQSCMWMAGATGTYSAGPLATAYPPTVHTGVGALVAPGDAQFAYQRKAARDNHTRTLYMASIWPSACTDEPTATRPPQTAQTQAAQVATDGHRTAQASATVTNVHALDGPYLLVCLLGYRVEPPFPPGQHHPPMGKGLPYDPPSRRTPPNKRRLHPLLTRVVRDRIADGDIEKNPGPVDAQTTENDIPPPNTKRWSPGWRVKSKRSPTPTTPLNYTNTQHRHSRRHYKESDEHPPPP